MLEKLTISNYALIDRLELDFESGLSIITGETGAGKSIILGALSLLLGGRADSRVITDESRKSVVEAEFRINAEELEWWFKANDIEAEGDLLTIRREVSATGRSRSFVNDSAVNLQSLNDLSRSLVDIHSQHANARLNDMNIRLEIIDSMSDNSELRKRYCEEYSRFVAIRNRIRRIREEQKSAKENRELLEFQFSQLKELNPKRGELAEVENRYKLLSEADDLREKLEVALTLLTESDNGIIDRLSGVRRSVDGVKFSLWGLENEGDSTLSTRVEDASLELQDISETLADCLSEVNADPDELRKMSERMTAYYDAMKRFHISQADELVDYYEDIQLRLRVSDGDNEELKNLENEGYRLADEIKRLARELTESRRQGALEFSRQMTERGRCLGLPNLQFRVDIEEAKLTSVGQDKIEFNCSFNKNQNLMPVTAVASGGEISRLMLTMKGILSSRMKLPTIIFDEVDTGVSGEIADLMGELMNKMGYDMQVLTITHLPQVAAKGKSHFKVFKKDIGERTQTFVKSLTSEERIKEIAGMISGSNITEAALQNAKALLTNKK